MRMQTASDVCLTVPLPGSATKCVAELAATEAAGQTCLISGLPADPTDTAGPAQAAGPPTLRWCLQSVPGESQRILRFRVRCNPPPPTATPTNMQLAGGGRGRGRGRGARSPSPPGRSSSPGSEASGLEAAAAAAEWAAGLLPGPIGLGFVLPVRIPQSYG